MLTPGGERACSLLTMRGSVSEVSLLAWKGKGEGMRALPCHCRRHLEAEDDEALFAAVRDHIMREHPAISPPMSR